TYTYITANEMGDIPFSCPSDYPYTSTIIKDACQIRSANLSLVRLDLKGQIISRVRPWEK
ncbi:1894_t:CDS:2, partial [Gigaspora margarita]